MYSDLMKRAIVLLLTHAILFGTQATLFAQQVEQQPPISNYFDAANGTRVEQLVQTALARNADLLAARQRIAETQGLLRQSGFRTNPSIDASVGNGRILGSAGEREISLGYNHVFELGGKRERRVEVCDIGIQLAQFEVAVWDRLQGAEARSGHTELHAAVHIGIIPKKQIEDAGIKS
jgi:outer membrane protein TolC